MKADMIGYMCEDYGYGMDDQLIYLDIEKYDESLSENGKMSTNGMETLAYNNGPVSHEPSIPTENDNDVSFYGEGDVKYTDLRGTVCACED